MICPRTKGKVPFQQFPRSEFLPLRIAHAAFWRQRESNRCRGPLAPYLWPSQPRAHLKASVPRRRRSRTGNKESACSCSKSGRVGAGAGFCAISISTRPFGVRQYSFTMRSTTLKRSIAGTILSVAQLRPSVLRSRAALWDAVAGSSSKGRSCQVWLHKGDRNRACILKPRRTDSPRGWQQAWLALQLISVEHHEAARLPPS